MTIFSDTSSIEIFINHGQYTLTSRVYDDVKVVQLSSHRKLKGTYYLLNSFKIND